MSTLCNLLHFFLLLPEAIFNNNVQQQQQCGGSPNRIFKKRRKHWTLAALSIARDLPLPRLHLAPKSKLWNGCCDLRESLGSSNLPAIDFGEVRCWGGFQGLLAVKILKIRWPRSSFLCFFFCLITTSSGSFSELYRRLSSRWIFMGKSNRLGQRERKPNEEHAGNANKETDDMNRTQGG